MAHGHSLGNSKRTAINVKVAATDICGNYFEDSAMGCAFPLRGYQLWKFEGVDLHFQGLLESHDSVTGRSHFVTSVR